MIIYEAKNHILIHADNISPIMHSHMAAHIIISLGGDITLSSKKYELTGKGMLIPAGVQHKINTYATESLVFALSQPNISATLQTKLSTFSSFNCVWLKRL